MCDTITKLKLHARRRGMRAFFVRNAQGQNDGMVFMEYDRAIGRVVYHRSAPTEERNWDWCCGEPARRLVRSGV